MDDFMKPKEVQEMIRKDLKAINLTKEEFVKKFYDDPQSIPDTFERLRLISLLNLSVDDDIINILTQEKKDEIIKDYLDDTSEYKRSVRVTKDKEVTYGKLSKFGFYIGNVIDKMVVFKHERMCSPFALPSLYVVVVFNDSEFTKAKHAYVEIGNTGKWYFDIGLTMNDILDAVKMIKNNN